MLVVVSDPKSARAWQREVQRDKAVVLYGRKIGETFDGGVVGLPGYVLRITGGSDSSGCPMRREIEGPGRARALLSQPPGVRGLRVGERRRKLVRGNTVSEAIVQLNVVIVQAGERPLEELGFAAPPAESKKAERP